MAQHRQRIAQQRMIPRQQIVPRQQNFLAYTRADQVLASRYVNALEPVMDSY